MSVTIKQGTITDLDAYIARQLYHFSPSNSPEEDRAVIATSSRAALARMEPLLASIKNFTPGIFDPYHSLQHSSFLYLLAHQLWKDGANERLCERLFGLNRAFHSIDLFYRVEMPEIFFLSHGLGAVLGNARYGTRLVVFQNVTVGRVGDNSPSIDTDVVLYPGAVVTGNSHVGKHCVISAGTVVHNKTIPDNTLAFMDGGQFALKPLSRSYSELYFR